MKFKFKNLYNKKILQLSFIIFAIFILLSIVLNPSKDDFKYYLTDMVKSEIIKNGGTIDNANLIIGLANLLIDADKTFIQRNNYYIFSSYKINLSIIRGFGYSIDDVHAVGFFKNFVIINNTE